MKPFIAGELALLVAVHPKNVERVRKAIEESCACSETLKALGFLVEVHGSELIPEDVWTGNYILQDGSVVDANFLEIRERFVTYGREDAKWLLYAGRIREERRIVASVFPTKTLQKLNDRWRIVTTKVSDSAQVNELMEFFFGKERDYTRLSPFGPQSFFTTYRGS